jgi:transcriptional regulator with XRE-family HTH domain
MPIRRPDSQAERAHAFGARVRSLRRAKKLTQRQVAIDVAELFKLAGRDVGGASFEQQVLSELHRLRRDMHAGFERLDAAIAALSKQSQAVDDASLRQNT